MGNSQGQPRISNATDESVDFIFSSQMLTPVERTTTSTWGHKINVNGNLLDKQMGILIEQGHNAVTIQKRENKIHKFFMEPKQTEQLPLLQKCNFYTIIISGKVLRENVPIISNQFRRILYKTDHYYIGVLEKGEFWRMRDSGSNQRRNYPPGMKCQRCGQQKECILLLKGIAQSMLYNGLLLRKIVPEWLPPSCRRGNWKVVHTKETDEK